MELLRRGGGLAALGLAVAFCVLFVAGGASSPVTGDPGAAATPAAMQPPDGDDSSAGLTLEEKDAAHEILGGFLLPAPAGVAITESSPGEPYASSRPSVSRSPPA